MRVSIAQINTTPGDFIGNQARIIRGIKQADASASDLVVFPELSIPGYLSQDLMYHADFIERNLQVLQELQAVSADCHEGLHIVLGYIDANPHPGKPFRNMAAVLHGGEVLCTYQKQRLPFYDVFDELRYFEPGTASTTFELAGKKAGLAICEDLWNDKSSDGYPYSGHPQSQDKKSPLAQYKAAAVEVLISLNSSPFVHGKCLQRLSSLAAATDDDLTLIYVNQCGAQDELVFDGQSFVICGNRLVYLSETIFEDSCDLVELALADHAVLAPQSGATTHPHAPWLMQEQTLNPQLVDRQIPLVDLLVLGLKDYATKSGFSDLVLASSGGVDSAVVCKLACDALGARHVHAVRMPSIYTSEESTADAQQLHANLGCWDYEVPVAHESLVQLLGESYLYGREGHQEPDNLVTQRMAQGGYHQVADENIQARLRDLYLMYFSNAYGAMPLSTGNKTESGCGYFTHFDMNFSYAPIKDLYKFQVVDIATADARVPANIWRKPPSAELHQGQTDEQSLLPYAILDPIVMAYVEYYVTQFAGLGTWVEEMRRTQQKISGDAQQLSRWLASSRAPSDYQRIVSLIGKMEYKRRQTCPGTKVSQVAFGTGRRLPLVERWSPTSA